MDADEEHRQTAKSPGAIGENPTRVRIIVVMPHIDDDVQPQSTVRGDRLIQRCVHQRHKRFNLRPLSTGPQTDSRSIAWRNDVANEHVGTQIHPDTVERFLDGGDDARFPRARRAIQDDDLASVDW